MGAIASQITSITIVYSTVYWHADQRKHQSSASLAFVRGIHRGPVTSPHKCPVTRKMYPFDDVIMALSTVFSTLNVFIFMGIRKIFKEENRKPELYTYRPRFNTKTNFPGVLIPIIMKQRDHLISIMDISLLVKRCLQSHHTNNTDFWFYSLVFLANSFEFRISQN